MENKVIITVVGKDTVGIIARICTYLAGNGVNVLGIGDSPYDNLEQPLKDALTEYYKVDSMEDYDHIIDELERSGSGDVGQVRAARSFCSRKGILPQQGSQRRIYSHGSSRTSTSWSREPRSSSGGEAARERTEPQKTLKEER